MKYLMAGAGLRAVPTMGTQDSRKSDVFGDSPVEPHEWWDGLGVQAIPDPYG